MAAVDTEHITHRCCVLSWHCEENLLILFYSMFKDGGVVVLMWVAVTPRMAVLEIMCFFNQII